MKTDESHRPGRCLLSRCLSSLVSGDYESARVRFANRRREVDSISDPNHRNSLPASTSASSPLPTEKRFPTLETFNLLLHRPVSRMELRWDLVKPLSMSRVNNWLNCVPILDGPALGSNVLSAQIHFKESRLWRLEHLWGPVVVRAEGPDQPITLRRLLNEIFNFFHYPIKDINYAAAAASMRREDIVDSWRQRNYNTYQPGYRKSPYMHDPFIRRVDFLLGFSLFRKLRLDSIFGQSCYLVLSIR
jgi:hypothetical protein